MAKKRSRVEVIQGILSIIKENKNSVKPTPLLRYSNLSSARFMDYMSELIQKGFVKEITDRHGRKFYSLADKGFLFLERYSIIRHFISDFDL